MARKLDDEMLSTLSDKLSHSSELDFNDSDTNHIYQLPTNKASNSFKRSKDSESDDQSTVSEEEKEE